MRTISLRTLISLLLLVVGLSLVGCAAPPIASGDRDLAAKAFTPQPGKGNIYVYRNEHFGAAVPMDVLVNGDLVGKTGAQTYFALMVTPGKHTITSKAENVSTVDLSVEAGKNYFVWQEVKMGLLFARTQLQLVDEATGRAGVNECKLIDAFIR